jgi:uncharacterized membrane protein YhhN
VTDSQKRFSAKRQFALLSGYVALSAADTWLASTNEGNRVRWITKPLLMPTLAAAMTQRPNNELATTTYVGLAGSWLGDIALLQSGNSALKRGLLAFSVAQSSYIAGTFRARDRSAPLTQNPVARKAIMVGLATAPGVAIAATRKDPVLGPAVAGYGALLATHAATASHLGPSRVSKRNRRLRLLGAATFLLSDSILGIRKFFVKGNPEIMEGAVMATYTAAQLMITEATRSSRPQG